MALSVCGLNMNRLRKELQPHGTPEFPCGGYESALTDRPEDVISWHWHEEFEVISIPDGCARLMLPSETVHVRAGELAVINANALHYAEGAPAGALRSLVFSPMLVAGSGSSAMYTKYIAPLAAFQGFTCLTFDADDELSRAFAPAFLALKDETDCYEFTVRGYLTRVLLAVYRRFAPLPAAADAPQSTDAQRLTRMLDFIHADCARRITLSDIARAADIGEREALRCFRRTIGESPVQYLLKYRLMQSAALLGAEPDASISQIAGQCGFDSPGYYAKKFRELYGCTPRDYSRTHTRS